MGRDAELGTVAVGKRADLILVQGNPLTDIRRTRDIQGVIVDGAWFSASDRLQLLETVANAYR